MAYWVRLVSAGEPVGRVRLAATDNDAAWLEAEDYAETWREWHGQPVVVDVEETDA